MGQNVEVPEPYPPGPWIQAYYDEDGRLEDIECICGAHPGTYRAFRSGVSFEEAANELRDLNQLQESAEGEGEYKPQLTGGDWHEEAPGGFRSRGPVLWMMRVIKLQRFYDAHEVCGDDSDWDEFCEEYPDAPNCQGFEEWIEAGRPLGVVEDEGIPF